MSFIIHTSLYLYVIKTLALFLALMVSLMATGPLCAFDHCPGDKMETTGGDHRPGDKDGCGTCSAFDACHVCAVHVLPEHVVVRLALAAEAPAYGVLIQSWPEAATGQLNSYTAETWRPPAP